MATKFIKNAAIPQRVITSTGQVIFEGQDIKDGQNVWQSMGGQEVGSVWGHGAYLCPDWTADWLHREAIYLSVVKSEYAYHMKLCQAKNRPVWNAGFNLTP